jgi:hypothetical protein
VSAVGTSEEHFTLLRYDKDILDVIPTALYEISLNHIG